MLSRLIAGLAIGLILFELRLAGQNMRGAIEPPDVYHFAPPLEYVSRYEHDVSRKKLIRNADFFCTRCVKEGRLPFASRDEISDKLEITKTYPYPVQGRTEETFGFFRMLEFDGAVTLKFIDEELEPKNGTYIEDATFRLFVDFEGFNTKIEPYPRRVEELTQLADVFPEVSDKTVVLNPHHRAHLYLIRAHRVLRDFHGLIEFRPDVPWIAHRGPYLGNRGKFEIYIFDKQVKIGRLMQHFLGSDRRLNGICWHTLKDNSMVACMHSENLRDVDLNNTFTHRLAFNFLTCLRGYQYDPPAWLVLGFGHLMERRERTDFNTFILGEGRVPDLWNESKWKPGVRKQVERDRIRPLVEFANAKEVGAIPPEEHGVCWSLVSYLCQLDQKKFGAFLHVIKDKKEGESLYNLQVRAFKDVYNVTMTRLFDDWKAWVIATYPAM